MKQDDAHNRDLPSGRTPTLSSRWTWHAADLTSVTYVKKAVRQLVTIQVQRHSKYSRRPFPSH